MPRLDVTATAVTKLTKPGNYRVARGLYLQISATGTRSWCLRYRDPSGRDREMGLGSAAVVTLANAKKAAMEAQRLAHTGTDPISARKDTRNAASDKRTFKVAAEAFLEAHRAGWANPKHAAQVRSTLEAYAFPVLGAMPVGAIQVENVLSVLQPIWAAKPETAARVRMRVEAVLGYAKALRWFKGENVATWRGNLDALLPPRRRMAPVVHHAALPWQDLPDIMARLAQSSGVAAACMRFSVLTAARSGEARGARWSEISLTDAVWTIPADRMKAKKEHRVPLSVAAIAVLESMAVLRDEEHGGLVFPGQRLGRVLSDVAVAKGLRTAGGGAATPHGVARSSFRDWCADQAVDRELAEACLAHAVGSAVEQAYRRGDILHRRREVMQRWGEHLAGSGCGVIVRLARSA